jgi:hypothetical protein
MAQRIYSVGIIRDFRWSKSSGTDSWSSPVCLQQTKQKRQSSTRSVATRCSSITRSNKNSPATLSGNIQSMKKSAFKMLCKFI